MIAEHATVGIVVTCDGSFGDIPRANYIEAEERTVAELKNLGKPFLILLNSEKPYSEPVTTEAAALQEKYGVAVLPVNCAQLKKEDVTKILTQLLLRVPAGARGIFRAPLDGMLPPEHKIRQDMIAHIREMAERLQTIRDMKQENLELDSCVYSAGCA